MSYKTVRTEVEHIESHYWSICDRPIDHDHATCEWAHCSEPAVGVAFLVDDVQQTEADNSGHHLYCDHHGNLVLRMAQESELRLPQEEIQRLWEDRIRDLYD